MLFVYRCLSSISELCLLNNPLSVFHIKCLLVLLLFRAMMTSTPAPGLPARAFCSVTLAEKVALSVTKCQCSQSDTASKIPWLIFPC